MENVTPIQGTVLDGLDPNGNISDTGPGDQPFSREGLSALRDDYDKATTEEKPKTKRGRPRGSKGTKSKAKIPIPELTQEQVTGLLYPLFKALNMVLEGREINPLSEQEIQGGIMAWYPIVDRYMPSMDVYGIWIAPLLWTSAVITMRIPYDVEKKEVPKVVEKDAHSKKN